MELEGYLPPGSYTTDTVLAVMEQYARKDSVSEVIQTLVKDIVSQILYTDCVSHAVACRNWVLANLLYVKDPGEAKRLFGVRDADMEQGDLEMVKSPLATLESGRYDCDCGAVLIASMLLALGIPARFVAVSFHPQSVTGPDGYSHVFTQAYCGDEWITLDPVAYPEEDKMLKEVKYFKAHNIS